jgi:hypothetical protein
MDLELIALASPEIWCFLLLRPVLPTPPTNLTREIWWDSFGIWGAHGVNLLRRSKTASPCPSLSLVFPRIIVSRLVLVGFRSACLCCFTATAACLLTLAAFCRSPARSSPAPARASSSCSSADTCCCSSSPRHLTTSLSSPQSTYLPG